MEAMTFHQFYNEHAPKRHNISNACVFCLGAYDWKPREKTLPHNLKHMIECLNKFVERNRIRTVETPAESLTPPDIPICGDRCRKSWWRPRDMCGRDKDRTNEYLGFYEPVFEKPDMWVEPGGVKFDARCGLGPDAYAIVMKYLQEDMHCCHLMVKHTAFEAFVRVMTPIRDKFVVLSYGCLRDGLTL
ncbi:hypothetical protein AVEN_273853-1 [Araneus ventricosus]|uniref:Uncharacterized protein n=1 Tax=Araneus ventricosus TaxID=182803 RepID=A0A4Y2BKM9_ARAVE|nr:hypothetical protein AVEN_273853-1 [Araneus ventricosus]